MIDKNITSRVATALAGIPLLMLVIGWDSPWPFSLFILLITVGALREYFSIAFPGQRREQMTGVVSGALISMGMILPGRADAEVWLGAVVIGVFFTYLFSAGSSEQRYSRLGWTLVGVVYLGYFLPHFVLLYRSPHGREWVSFILLVIMTGDMAAYFVGRTLGKNKLSPGISPGKTVEGALGGAAASVLVGLLGGGFLLPAISAVEALLLSFCLSLVGQTGDLFESWIKRAFSVKDSGAILPGHGGLLDRVDSLIFPAVLTTYYVRFVH